MEGWIQEEREKFPIKPEHIGEPVCLCEDPNGKNFILLDIKKPGSPRYPEGGYLVKHPDYYFPQSLFFEQAKAFPPKKPKKVKVVKPKKAEKKVVKQKEVVKPVKTKEVKPVKNKEEKVEVKIKKERKPREKKA
jgi:hypothetical protein